MQITQELLHKLLDYNPDTGIFNYKARPSDLPRYTKDDIRWNKRYAGKVAGFLFETGYIGLSIYGNQQLAHRMAFLYCHGHLPKVVDHKDQDITNNRIGNLRQATRSQNAMNSKVISTNSTGVKGVGLHKPTGKYRARIMLNKKETHLGLFDTIEEAKVVIQAKRIELHGEFASEG